jgi:D-cysteine desulfhydrase family pyridoxal phosphate-dependent enzyme
MRESDLIYDIQNASLEIPMSSLDVKPIRFAHLPTPIEELPRLSQHLGCSQLLIKRDDQTGLAFGGNKTRKLEYLLGDADAKGARTLITRGAAQSNHCRQTAAAAARFGFDCVLVLTGSPPRQQTGNILLDRIVNAELVWTEEHEPEQMLQETYAELESEGRKPYLIPYGGSNYLGVFAYVEAMKELILQLPDLNRIVFASSSGGTQAGLCLGAQLYNFKGKITGISVDPSAPALRKKVCEIANITASRMGSEIRIQEKQIEVVDAFLGGGYGIVGDLERDAIQTFGRHEGILLDPVYTGRAAGGMIELIKSGIISSKERVLFWHTGGTPSLFAYAAELI